MKKFLLALFGIWIILLLCLVFGGCTSTKYIPVETIRIEREEVHDTLTVIDSISSKDSVNTTTSMLLQKVDSAHLASLGVVNPPNEAWLLDRQTTTTHTKNENKSRQEEEKINSNSKTIEYIQVPYPVERKLSKWEQVKMDWGGKAIVVIIVILFILMWLVIRRFTAVNSNQ